VELNVLASYQCRTPDTSSIWSFSVKSTLESNYWLEMNHWDNIGLLALQIFNKKNHKCDLTGIEKVEKLP